jgi:hypothetical protein
VSEPGVASDGVVAVQPAKRAESGLALIGEGAAALQRLALNVALNDSARALSAELPTALIECRTPACAPACSRSSAFQISASAFLAPGCADFGSAASTLPIFVEPERWVQVIFRQSGGSAVATSIHPKTAGHTPHRWTRPRLSPCTRCIQSGRRSPRCLS